MMQLIRTDSECTYRFSLYLHLFPTGTGSVPLSNQTVPEENHCNSDIFFCPKQNRIWQSNKNFCAFRLFPWGVESSSWVLWEAYISSANYNHKTSWLLCGGNRKYQLLTKTEHIELLVMCSYGRYWQWDCISYYGFSAIAILWLSISLSTLGRKKTPANQYNRSSIDRVVPRWPILCYGQCRWERVLGGNLPFPYRQN